MTTREFAASLFEDHFMKGVDHTKSGWGHNFNRDFEDARDSTYAAISCILHFWRHTDDSVNLLIAWLREKELSKPWNASSILAWNLYYSLHKDQIGMDSRMLEQKNRMFSFLRHIELNSLHKLNEEQQKRLTDITSYIMGPNHYNSETK